MHKKYGGSVDTFKNSLVNFLKYATFSFDQVSHPRTQLECISNSSSAFQYTDDAGYVREVNVSLSPGSSTEILEDTDPDSFFTNPHTDRAKDFLGKILAH